MSQYASAIRTVSGCRVRSSAIDGRARTPPYGGCPARVPQVLAKTSLVMSIAMSQRMPSH